MKIKDVFERIGLNANVSIFGMNNKQDFVKLWNGTIEENMDFMHVPYGYYEVRNVAIIRKDGKEEIYLLFKYPKLTKKQREIVGKRAVGYPYPTDWIEYLYVKYRDWNKVYEILEKPKEEVYKEIKIEIQNDDVKCVFRLFANEFRKTLHIEIKNDIINI